MIPEHTHPDIVKSIEDIIWLHTYVFIPMALLLLSLLSGGLRWLWNEVKEVRNNDLMHIDQAILEIRTELRSNREEMVDNRRRIRDLELR